MSNHSYDACRSVDLKLITKFTFRSIIHHVTTLSSSSSGSDFPWYTACNIVRARDLSLYT